MSTDQEVFGQGTSTQLPKNIGAAKDSNNEKNEDLEVSTIQARHGRCLQEERLKYSTFVPQEIYQKRKKGNSDDSVFAGNGNIKK